MIYFCRKTIEKQEKHTKQTENARELLLAGLRLEYGIERLPVIAASELGKPYFPEMPQIFFNYSHCREGILCGISSTPNGVDMCGITKDRWLSGCVMNRKCLFCRKQRRRTGC